MNKHLIRKYNVPGPRYTSYPTVPYWDKTPPTPETWVFKVKETFEQDPAQGVSIYIHLPYCESLCTYCGCNTRITVNHQVEKPYIEALLKEWDMYLKILGRKPLVREIHLGGGTPTFFSAQHLSFLINEILKNIDPTNVPEMSFEAHPNNTTGVHLKTLYALGFRRLSLGIQDFDPVVQQMIHRIQPFEKVKQITEAARTLGYTSINYDLIYGLPCQTIASVQETIHKTALLYPDRIAFYSYAHVPWLKPAQKLFEDHLPSYEEKRQLYERGKNMLEAYGYQEIGMDHFALVTDSLYKASREGTLHRNFMGYGTQSTRLLIGLGTSAISDTWTAFAQNHKVVEYYLQAIEKGKLPIQKGHQLTAEDLFLRQHILNLMCHLQTSWKKETDEGIPLAQAISRLREMEQDQLVHLTNHSISVTSEGKAYIRNVCMALDARMWRQQPETALFSSTI